MRDGSDLGARVTDLLLRYLASAPDRAEPVVRFAAPAELEAAFRAAGADLPLGPVQSPLSDDALLAAVETTLRYSVRTQHPRFFNQNFASADPVAVLGDWVAAAAHTTGATYEMAPVFTLMERALIARLAEVASLQPAEGMLNPGGALSNLYALHLARCRAAPASLAQGLHQGPRLLAFASAHAHYSLDKSVALAGIGREALHRVPCDEAGRLRPEALAAALLRAKQRGDRPFFVCATAGTTVVGAFDPLPEIAALCAEHDVWLHVDGCHGASVLFSPRHRHLLRGIESADSLAWDLHKMLGLTQQCAVLLVRAPGQLRAAFASQAGYLFQPDKNHAELDLGDLTFQCARRIDSFKLWLTWKARGDEGFAHRVDQAMALAAHAAALLRDDPRFFLCYPPSFTHACFYWVPRALRPLRDPRAPDVAGRLSQVTTAIKDRMQRAGTTLLGYQPMDGMPNFFRLLILNPEVTRADIEDTLAWIDRHGQEVEEIA